MLFGSPEEVVERIRGTAGNVSRHCSEVVGDVAPENLVGLVLTLLDFA